MKPTIKSCFFILCVFYGLLFFLCKDIPFFQDNILFSAKIPMHFFQTGFLNFPLPAHIDVGYPPLWAWLIALSWKILGQQLWVGHLLCLPILITTAWFYLKIAAYFLPEKHLWFAALFLILEPTYLAQSTMVGPDIFLVMAFMGGLYSMIYRKPLLLVLMTILLAMTSVRGAIIVFTLFINQLIFNFYQNFTEIKSSKNTQENTQENNPYWKTILPYTISGFLFLGWMLLHYQNTGYFLVTDQSPWAGHHQLANLKTIIFNVAITVWRFLDFGRIVLYGFLAFLLFQFFYQKKLCTPKEKVLLLWAFAPLLILIFILCMRTNPILHRYFMVYFLLHGLCLGVFVFKEGVSKIKKLSLSILSLALLTGHLWIYPNHMAQGWDASLAHLPYFSIRKKMIEFIEQEKIPYAEITTTFPNINGMYYSDLSKQAWNFTPKHKLPLAQSNYVMQSNVMNDFSEKELEHLASNQFKKIRSFRKMGVYMHLYKHSRVKVFDKTNFDPDQ